MSDDLTLFVVFGVAGLASIVVTTLMGKHAERAACRRYNARTADSLPRHIVHQAWESTARPFAQVVGVFGIGVFLLTDFDSRVLAALVGFVLGGSIRGGIGNPRSS